MHRILIEEAEARERKQAAQLRAARRGQADVATRGMTREVRQQLKRTSAWTNAVKAHQGGTAAKASPMPSRSSAMRISASAGALHTKVLAKGPGGGGAAKPQAAASASKLPKQSSVTADPMDDDEADDQVMAVPPLQSVGELEPRKTLLRHLADPGFLDLEPEGYVQLITRSMATQYERQVQRQRGAIAAASTPKVHIAALTYAERRAQQCAPLLGALEREAHGLQLALRLLRCVAASDHGMGLSEAHAYQIMEKELPSRGAGSVWTLAMQHVHLLLPFPAAGMYYKPHPSIGAALRLTLFQVEWL